MRIVVAEDQYLLREGLTHLIRSHGHHVVAAVADAHSALRALRQHRPDLAVLDIRMPPTHSDEGLQLALQIRAERPEASVLILSQHLEQLYARELLANGAAGVGYLLKDRVFNAATFMEAVERVAAGGTALDPEVVSRMMRAEPASSLASLTDREKDVLSLMAEGLSNQAIAGRLFLSEGAISKYTTSIFAKLGIEHNGAANRRVRAVLAYLNSPRAV
ncbi:response regulator transcription factor [Nesterenkonia alba]|uniref:response regulator transcription factor n=1 Tax=Nesterenkonia alba TaxID=515814 RepID=UPI0003B66BF0|nr:response regulator transcription factor [Nesterenkonia alba]